MKLQDLFVPRWQNSNPDIRKKAVMKMRDASLLSQIAEKDQDQGVCRAASQRLSELEGDFSQAVNA